jgi:hypothetical protein
MVVYRFFALQIDDVRFHVVNYDNVFGPSGDADQRYYIYIVQLLRCHTSLKLWHAYFAHVTDICQFREIFLYTVSYLLMEKVLEYKNVSCFFLSLAVRLGAKAKITRDVWNASDVI